MAPIKSVRLQIITPELNPLLLMRDVHKLLQSNKVFPVIQQKWQVAYLNNTAKQQDDTKPHVFVNDSFILAPEAYPL